MFLSVVLLRVFHLLKKITGLLPFAEKDRLLRNDYPKIERRRAMSETESQEKMVLWKLRCSATRQKSSNTGFMINGQGT